MLHYNRGMVLQHLQGHYIQELMPEPVHSAAPWWLWLHHVYMSCDLSSVLRSNLLLQFFMIIHLVILLSWLSRRYWNRQRRWKEVTSQYFYKKMISTHMFKYDLCCSTLVPEERHDNHQRRHDHYKFKRVHCILMSVFWILLTSTYFPELSARWSVLLRVPLQWIQKQKDFYRTSIICSSWSLDTGSHSAENHIAKLLQ